MGWYYLEESIHRDNTNPLVQNPELLPTVSFVVVEIGAYIALLLFQATLSRVLFAEERPLVEALLHLRRKRARHSTSCSSFIARGGRYYTHLVDFLRLSSM